MYFGKETDFPTQAVSEVPKRGATKVMEGKQVCRHLSVMATCTAKSERTFKCTAFCSFIFLFFPAISGPCSVL